MEVRWAAGWRHLPAGFQVARVADRSRTAELRESISPSESARQPTRASSTMSGSNFAVARRRDLGPTVHEPRKGNRRLGRCRMDQIPHWEAVVAKASRQSSFEEHDVR